MGGRPPMPNEYHQLTKPKLYNIQAERVKNTPKAKKTIKPRCPAHLSKEEKKQWRLYAKILANYNMFTVGNQKLLDLLAVSTTQYNECLEKVRATGLLIKSPNGFPVYNPYFVALNKLEDKMMRCLKELGMSSTGLAGIGALMTRATHSKSKMEELMD